MTTDLFKRTPPHSIEAEKAVLGAVLAIDDRPQLFDELSEIIDADDFYSESHRTIWRGMRALAEAKRPIDAITLGDVLKPQLEQIGGYHYIAELAAFPPVPSTAIYYARIVREKSIQRGVAEFGLEVAARALDAPANWNPEWTEELLAVAEFELSSVASRAIRKPEPKKSEMLNTVLWNLEHGIKRGVPTGFPRFDRNFGGFNVGHVSILAARTSKGKTAFATQVSINAAKLGHPVAYFTLEMPAEEIYLRAIGSLAKLDTFAVANWGGLQDEEKAGADAARQALDAMPLEILYRPSMRPRDLRIECRRLMREMGGLKLAVIDYFGLMRGNYREREHWREMQEAIRDVKGVADELGIPILVLAQVNREGDERVPPMLSHLRDTGAIEEHASNVLTIWHEPPPDHAPPPAHDAWQETNVIISKQRNGPAGLRVQFKFKKSWGIFTDE